MYKYLIAGLACVMAVLGPALAAPHAIFPNTTSEFALTGEYVQKPDALNPWTVNIGLLFGDSLKVGPEVVVGTDNTLNRMGVATEWNVLGPKAAITPFVGGSALYFQRPVCDVERYVVTARAGFKVRIGPSAYLKAYAFNIVDGRGKESSDIGAAAGVVALF